MKLLARSSAGVVPKYHSGRRSSQLERLVKIVSLEGAVVGIAGVAKLRNNGNEIPGIKLRKE